MYVWLSRENSQNFLWCSGAILRYLCDKYQLPDHWYPKDLQSRAKVDEALSWFPANLRCGAFFQGVSQLCMVHVCDYYYL